MVSQGCTCAKDLRKKMKGVPMWYTCSVMEEEDEGVPTDAQVLQNGGRG